MNSKQYSRRQALLFQISAILRKWSDRTGEGFLRELSAIVRDLEALVAEVEESSSDRLERARNYRYLGNAYFDLGAGRNPKWLERAVVAYTLAEALLDGVENPAERAKLAYSHGLTLFAKSQHNDVRLVEEARLKYAHALTLARKAMPEAVETILKATVVADQLIDLLRNRKHICREIDDLAKSQNEQSPSATTGTSNAPRDALLFERLIHNLSESSQLAYGDETAGVLAL